MGKETKELPTFRSVGINPLWWLTGIAGSLLFTVIVTWIYFQLQFDAADRARFVQFMVDGYARPINPDPTPLWSQPLSVQLHVFSVTIAFFSGLVVFLLPKGTGLHRLLGWSFVVSMIGAAATSIMMIADLGTGINFLHVFTVITAVSLTLGLYAIRRGDVRNHAGNMVGLYIGGLLIAGTFAFLPGRLMWRILFGD
jgi:uncharacterized membrane protein